MTHLVLGLEAGTIRREPYIPTVSEFPVMQAGRIGLKAAHYAGVFVMPGPAGYVGGDIVSGVLYTGFHRSGEMTLFIDIGTNGEIVLGNNEFLMTAACSAGPAFEEAVSAGACGPKRVPLKKSSLIRSPESLNIKPWMIKPPVASAGPE